MKVGEAKDYVGGLSKPSKMPGSAYSIPARECKAGGALRDVVGSVCHGCYALKGRYVFPNVQDAQYRRMAAIDKPEWCAAMATAINGQPWFRWHDSGDLQSVDHLRKIVEVCNATPQTAHWLPTRERGIVRDYKRAGGIIPANLTIRLSATMVDGDVKSPWSDVNTSTVHKAAAATGHACPAPTQGGKCGDCRACWSRDVLNVSYGAH
jgi:hypothetical protein